MDTSPGGLDWDEEPLFADDINSDDEDPPPLPPLMPPLSQLSQAPNRTHPGADGEEGEMADWDTSQRRTTTDGDQRGTDQDAPPQKKRAPILTLTVDRIFSEKGLPYLEKEFPKLKFKGKGHEAADLRYLMKHYEHWANSLYPKLTFKDVTDRIEKLATKKEFKTQLVQMRHRWVQRSTPPRPVHNEAHDITEHHHDNSPSDDHHHSNSPTHQQNEVNSTPESPPNSSQTRQETATETTATSTGVRVPEAVEDELDGLLAEEEQLMMEESDSHIPSGFDF